MIKSIRHLISLSIIIYKFSALDGIISISVMYFFRSFSCWILNVFRIHFHLLACPVKKQRVKFSHRACMYMAHCQLLGLLASALVINATGLELVKLMIDAVSEKKPPLTFVCAHQIQVVN
jgi:hypothetical protein